MSSEEQACLVRTRSDSENSCGGKSINSFGSLAYTKMAYATDTRVPSETTTGANGPPEPANVSNAVAAANNLMAAQEVGGSLNNIESNESGELIDYNDLSLLSQFHEDAMTRAGCGVSQIRLTAVLSLAMAGPAIEYAVVPYILPSAEIEFCILENEKSWLGMITLLGLCLGSLVWGNLADRLGRRRALASCLALNAVFSTIAAFMPTYGTFMMARFCSGLGSGGIAPSSWSSLAEVWRGRWRRTMAGAAILGGAGGALYAAALAPLVPATGREAVIENREHFSAWHRYLLLCTLPILATLVCLIWTHESPRYLLECGREVDAMAVYQRIHKRNRAGVCGVGGTQDIEGSNPGEFGLGELELELPNKRRSTNNPTGLSVWADMRYSNRMFWQAFARLFSSVHIGSTVTLGGAFFFASFCHYALTAYAPSAVARLEAAQYEYAKQIIIGETKANENYNESIENIDYVNATFTNCTFRDMFLSHVQFLNCTFENVEFSNIKSSLTFFKGCLLESTRFIDTDLSRLRHMDEWCVLRSSAVLSLPDTCRLDTDFRSRVDGVRREHASVAMAIGAAALLAALAFAVLPGLSRRSVVVVSLFICCVCTPAIYFVVQDLAIYITECIFKFLLTLTFYAGTLIVVEGYPTHIRCTAHGFMLFLLYVAAMIATSIYSNLNVHGYIVATLVTAVGAVLATMFALKIDDNAAKLL